jgi:hypothetical protein
LCDAEVIVYFGDVEVSQFGSAVAGEEDVGGFDVAVDDVVEV